MLTESATNSHTERMWDVIVAGAGFAGTFTALAAANRGNQVLVIDIGNTVISLKSSSFNECYKLHTGLHYAKHKATAEQCLRDAMAFAKALPQYILGAVNDPWRRGIHFIMSNSHVSAAEAIDVAEHLKKAYEAAVKKDPTNKVFGEPQEFIKYLEPADYAIQVAENIPFTAEDGKISNTQVVLAIQTGESQIDISLLKRELEAKFLSHPNITFLRRHEVETLGYVWGSLNYFVTAHDVETGASVIYKTKAIVNCTWQNIEKLDRTLGLQIPDDKIVRAKISVLAQLPPDLHKFNTCIFSIGAHCSFTNLGNGTAIITYEPITNAGEYLTSSTDIPDSVKELTSADLSLKPGTRGKDLADKILQGAARYIPALSRAKVKEVRLGYVKSTLNKEELKQSKTGPQKSYVSIYDKNSSIHQRKETGVIKRDLCVFDHAAIKMTYAVAGAESVANFLQASFCIRSRLEQLSELVKVSVITKLARLSTLTIDELALIGLNKLASHEDIALPDEILNYIIYNNFRDVLLENVSVTFKNLDEGFNDKIIQRLADKVVHIICLKNQTNHGSKSSPLSLSKTNPIDSIPSLTSNESTLSRASNYSGITAVDSRDDINLNLNSNINFLFTNKLASSSATVNAPRIIGTNDSAHVSIFAHNNI